MEFGIAQSRTRKRSKLGLSSGKDYQPSMSIPLSNNQYCNTRSPINHFTGWLDVMDARFGQQAKEDLEWVFLAIRNRCAN